MAHGTCTAASCCLVLVFVFAAACSLGGHSMATTAAAPPPVLPAAAPLPPWVERLLALAAAGSGNAPTLAAVKQRKQKPAVVASDAVAGDGQFATITAALQAAEDPVGSEQDPYIVLIKEGVYDELVSVTRKHVILIGAGMGRSIITGNKSVGIDNLSTNETATLRPAGKQAVALLSRSHNSLIYRCSIEGFQDTLDADTGRQMYLETWISGTVDFIFGYARACFLGCRLLVRRSIDGAHNVITAQGRSDPKDDSGFAFQYCSVTADDGANLTGVETFLGRPWKPHSHVVFMECFLDSIVNFTGWVEWNCSRGQIPDTVVYLEYGNSGPGADTSRRVKNRDVRVANCSEAASYTPGRFINAGDWMPKDVHGRQIIHYTDGLQRPCPSLQA
ncbi:hypothetical protein U9M48_032012 [Paspalum notatum var. saurae]|uniref:Pectinesterase n=1 Tax=Paspalum notatum var. saurae TaxID=547442 RepID=A0AAQ3U479_PASNO